VPGDYDGDGKTDVAVFRDGIWYILNSSNREVQGLQWGLDSDIPVPADYDGDGKVDVAVFRPSDNTWYVLRSTGGALIQPFGTSGDIPVPSANLP
jgi:glucan-binding YG repeat protein